MTDMEAINREAYNRFINANDTEQTDFDDMKAFADIRDQLIKEGWTQPDEAEELVDAVLKYSRVGAIQLVRRALAKARAHPADVVVAAKHVDDYVTDSHAMCLAAYILKDV